MESDFAVTELASSEVGGVGRWSPTSQSQSLPVVKWVVLEGGDMFVKDWERSQFIILSIYILSIYI